jgi:hypothetical protein
VPAKGDTAEPRAKAAEAPRYRLPAAELVQRAARRVVRGGKASFRSQAAFRAALIAQLRRDEPLATIGGHRLRRLLIGVPGVRIQVRYTERHDLRPLGKCPVCDSELRPIRNRTLAGETVTIGQRCSRCEYWTHSVRRVPVRYTFSQAGIDGRALRAAARA